jgi:hypothetical protein
MSNAKAMSPSIAASPPKRYGTGDCHGECGAVPFAPGAAVGAPWLTVGNSAPGLMVAWVLAVGYVREDRGEIRGVLVLAGGVEWREGVGAIYTQAGEIS